MLRLLARPCARARVGPLQVVHAAASTDEAEAEGWTAVQPPRLRLNNLSPQVGARRKDTRKGRGYGAGQVRPADTPPACFRVHIARHCADSPSK